MTKELVLKTNKKTVKKKKVFFNFVYKVQAYLGTHFETTILIKLFRNF